MKRILVTGARGFIGRQCLPMLQQNSFDVHAVSRGRVSDHLGAHWHQADLLAPGEAESLISDIKPTHLMHLAWCTTPGQYWTSMENIQWAEASLRLLRAFSQRGGRRLVAAGTCAEYDWEHPHCTESRTPLRPATLYGACKHSVQVVIESIAKQSDLSAAWARLFFLYGPHEHPARLVPSVIVPLMKKQMAHCSTGTQVRDFLHVNDAASALVALMESDVSGPVNIASGKPIALRSLVEMIAAEMDGADLVSYGTLPNAGTQPAVLTADTGRLFTEVGWEPRIDIANGLAQTITWWRLHAMQAETARAL